MDAPALASVVECDGYALDSIAVVRIALHLILEGIRDDCRRPIESLTPALVGKGLARDQVDFIFSENDLPVDRSVRHVNAAVARRHGEAARSPRHLVLRQGHAEGFNPSEYAL
jgi:hypothetical protein